MEDSFIVYAGLAEPPPVQQSPSSAVIVRELYSEALQLHQQGQLHEAANLYEQILSLDLDHAGATHYLGMVAFAEKRLDEALELISRSLQLCNTKAVYHNNHGVVLKESARYAEAKAAFEKAVSLNPSYPDALSNLGMISVLLKEPDQVGEKYLKQALKLQPNHVDALRHLSELYLKNDLHAEAKPLLDRLASLSPPNAKLEHQLGCVAGECGDIEQAKVHFRRAADLSGGQAVWRHKHLWYCPTVFENETQIDQYWETLNRDLDEAIAESKLYNWKTLVYEGFTHSFNLPHLDRCCKETLEKFTALFAPSFAHFEKPTWKPGEKIRVGFLVTPGHEGGFLRMTTGLIERLDPEKFEVRLIYNETTAKKFEKKFRRKDIVHVPYSWNFEDAVQRIKSAKCDVIYYWKVGADVWNFFLPMCHLAPIQCASWSTHGTSGVGQVDYYVTWDKAEAPDSPQDQYTERLHFFDIKPYFEPKLTDIPEPATRGELGLPESGAIYFCPHRPAKYHPMFDDYLRQILQRDPTGHIVLRLGKPSSLTNRLVTRMRNNIGEDLFRRVIVIPQQHVREYYKYLSVATVVLHSPIYSGEITSVDAFLYGVPSVAQTGKWLFQRYTSAFYEDFGIEGPATSDKEEYVKQAVKLGTDPEYRRAVSERILANHERFFENESSIREWERFFEKSVRNNGHKPRTGVRIPDAEAAVPMGRLEINVAYGCNLKCNYCSHFSDRMSGIAPTEELLENFRTWHTKLVPEKIRLIGGEPLLHPKLIAIIHEVKRHWPQARIDLVTNGLLFPKHPEILPLLRELGGHVFISRHFDNEHYLAEFDTAMRCLKESGVEFTLYTSERKWRKYYELDEVGTPIPYNSDPEKAWKNCQTKNSCPTLLDNRLWKCQHLAWSARAVAEGKLPKSWQAACDGISLSPESTAKEILAYLSSESVPGCAICPESYEFVSLSEKRSSRSSDDKPGFAVSQ